MSANVHIRNYCPADFNRYVAFYADFREPDQTGGALRTERIAESLRHPVCRPDRDFFLALADETLAGTCELTPELKIGRMLLNIRVHPRYRRMGIGSGLLDAAMARGRELGAYMLHANVEEANQTAKSFLVKHGFNVVRRYYDMRLNFADADGACRVDADPFITRPLQKGQEHRLTMMQNYFFKGSWGFNPNTVEMVCHEIGACGCSHEDIILTYDGSKPVGYCWTRVHRNEKNSRGAETGRIHMIGVNPEYRGEGLGKITLSAGLDHLREQGVGIVELTTDSKNTAANKLYRAMGFARHRVLLWYEACP